MISGLLLIFRPGPTWDAIKEAQKGIWSALIGNLLPLLVLTAAGEAAGLSRWGKPRGVVGQIRPYPLGEMVIYCAVQAVASIVVVFVMARLIKILGETFHGRHSFRQSFVVAAYAMAPFFLVRWLDAFPAVPVWVSWSFGTALAIGAFYHGLPRIMDPDPPHAFGLFFMTATFLVLISALWWFLSECYLRGKFSGVEHLFQQWGSKLPI